MCLNYSCCTISQSTKSTYRTKLDVKEWGKKISSDYFPDFLTAWFKNIAQVNLHTGLIWVRLAGVRILQHTSSDDIMGVLLLFCFIDNLLLCLLKTLLLIQCPFSVQSGKYSVPNFKTAVRQELHSQAAHSPASHSSGVLSAWFSLEMFWSREDVSTNHWRNKLKNALDNHQEGVWYACEFSCKCKTCSFTFFHFELRKHLWKSEGWLKCTVNLWFDLSQGS